MTTNEIKKGQKVRVFLESAGKEVDATIMDNKRGNIRDAHVFAAAIGYVDEIGSVYGYNITKVVNEDGTTTDVEHTEKQLKMKAWHKSVGF